MLHNAEHGAGGYSSRKVLEMMMTALKIMGMVHNSSQQKNIPLTNKIHQKRDGKKAGNVIWGYADPAHASLQSCVWFWISISRGEVVELKKVREGQLK